MRVVRSFSTPGGWWLVVRSFPTPPHPTPCVGSCQDADIAERLGQQLRRTIRLTHSSPPQHGAALVATILGEPERRAALPALVRLAMRVAE